AAHAAAHDIHHGEHAGFRTVNHAVFEIGEVSPTGSTRVNNSRYSGAKRESIRIQAVVSGIGAPHAGTGVGMNVDVDKARCGEKQQARQAGELLHLTTISIPGVLKKAAATVLASVADPIVEFGLLILAHAIILQNVQ